jgi:hypothetical protein
MGRMSAGLFVLEHLNGNLVLLERNFYELFFEATFVGF